MAYTRTSIVARTSSNANPITQSVTVPAGCTVMVVLLNAIGASVRAGGSVTWGEFTLTAPTAAQIAAASPEASCEAWYLENPPQGVAKTLTIPNSGGLTIKYTVDGGTPVAGGRSKFHTSNGANNTAANPSPGAITIVEANEILWAVTAGGWQSWAPSAQAGTIIANTDDGATGGGEQYSINPALGSFTLNWTFATSDDWGAIVLAFREIPPPNFENYKGVKSSSAGVMSVGERIR